jgi:hypothetical protein
MARCIACVRKRGAARLELWSGDGMPLLLSSATVERGEGGYRFTCRKAGVRMKSLLKEGGDAEG